MNSSAAMCLCVESRVLRRIRQIDILGPCTEPLLHSVPRPAHAIFSRTFLFSLSGNMRPVCTHHHHHHHDCRTAPNYQPAADVAAIKATAAQRQINPPACRRLCVHSPRRERERWVRFGRGWRFGVEAGVEKTFRQLLQSGFLLNRINHQSLLKSLQKQYLDFISNH